MSSKISLNELTIQTIINLENNKLLKDKISCLGLEVSFANNRRRADIMVISNKNQLVAFEIKSDYDNLLRLRDQIHDYKKSFDYVYVVVTNKHLQEVQNILLNIPSVGTILYNNSNMEVLVKAKKIKNINASNLISFNYKNPIVSTKEKQTLKSLVINSLKNKLLPIYNEFKMNYVPPYNEEHFSVLTMSKNIKYYLGL